MMTWLLILAPVIAVVVIVRIYQKKTAEREAASSKRFDEIFGATGKASQQPTPTPAPPTAARPVPPIPQLPAWVVNEKFLEPQAKLLYYLLKSGLPDHEIFAQVSVGAVISAGQPMRKPPEGVIDFVVCDKQMKPVAAIGLIGASAPDIIGDCIKAAGLRWVRIAPDALPARSDIRAVILGT
jgi:hypothetical protein